MTLTPDWVKYCSMIEQTPREEILNMFEEIEHNPAATQRAISCKLGMSLGKVNYLLNELLKKGLIKARNFSDNPGKLKRINYCLTKKGLEQKIRLLYFYLKIKEAEYNRIKQRLQELDTATKTTL